MHRPDPMTLCAACEGHLRVSESRCPHCGAAMHRSSATRMPATAALVAMGLTLSVTTACVGTAKYGAPPIDSMVETGAPAVDADSDGFPEGEDCDDTDAAINPDAEEIADDGVDSNCDGSDNT